MKKVALITFYENNYGSILQCFATKHCVESFGFQCDIICDQTINKPSFITRLKKIPIFFFKSLNPSFLKAYKKTKGLSKVNTLSIDSSKQMDIFVKSIFEPISVRTNDKNVLPYDFFIAGSDQIWNVNAFFYSFYFLTFATRNKRIAFAASFGISDIPKYNERALRKALNGFDYISVREETGVSIVKRYSNTKVCRIADPTFIYNADEWRNFAKDAVVPSQKYILVHFLNEPNEIALESMVWVSEKLDLKIIALGYKYNAFDNLKRFTFMDGGPWEYVSLIDHAEFVLTDSFHTSLFSINFDKRFFVFHRNYSVSKQTSRISDLLKRFGMEDRLIDNIDILKKIYLENQSAETRLILEKERATIRDYIQKSISGQVPQCFLQGENDAT